MSIYLREQSAGEILRGTINIYFRNFLPLWGMYFLPTFPIALLKLMIFRDQLAYWWLAEWLLVTPFAVAMLTGGVSDICVGNRPSIVRSLRRVFGTIFGKLVLTNLFLILIEAAAVFGPIGAVFYLWPNQGCTLGPLLLIPASALVVVFLIWWMFVPTVVVLERTFGWTALKRSKALGKGFYLRNGGVMFLLYLPIIPLGFLGWLYYMGQGSVLLKILSVGFLGVIAPLPLIATVLLYYELRARSEGYDLAMLGQDLRR